MAQLPDVRAFGSRPIPVAQSGIQTYEAGGLARAVQGAANEFDDIAARHQQENDAAELNEYRRRFNDFENDRLFGENGTYNKKAGDALGEPKAVESDFDKFTTETIAGIKNPNVQRAVRELAAARRNQITSDVTKYAFDQREKWLDDQYEADITSSVGRAANHATDPAVIATELKAVTARTVNRLRSQGAADSVIAVKAAEKRGEIHTAVVQRLLAAQDYDGAYAYFHGDEKTKGHADDIVDPDVKVKLQEAVHDGKAIMDSSSIASEAISAHPDDLASQLAYIKDKTDDPDVLSKARTLVRQDRTDRDQALSDWQKGQYSALWQSIHDGHIKSNAELNPSIVRQLTTEQQKGLDTALANARKGLEPATDWGKYTEFFSTAADPTLSREKKLALLDPSRYRNALSDSDYEKAVATYNDIQAGTGKFAVEQRSKSDIINGLTAKLAKSNKGSAEIVRQEFWRISAELQAQGALNPADPKYTEQLQQLGNRLMLDVYLPGPDGRLTKSHEKLWDIDIGDVDRQFKEEFVKEFHKEYDRKPSEEEIVNTYRRATLRNNFQPQQKPRIEESESLPSDSDLEIQDGFGYVPAGSAARGVDLARLPLPQRRSLNYKSPALVNYAAANEKRYGLTKGILRAILLEGEKSASGYAKSPAGALGHMQFMAESAKKFGLSDPTDPLQAVPAAARYMQYALKQYKGNVMAALADYNGGPKQAKYVMQGKEPPDPETRAYVFRTMNYLASLMNEETA